MRVLLASVALTLVLVGCADGENRPQLQPRGANVTPTTEVSSDTVAPSRVWRAGDASAAGPTAAGEDAPATDDLHTGAAVAVPASASTPDRINLRDPFERARIARVLEAADWLGSRASIRVSDRPLVGAERFVLGTWAAVVPQRHAVLDVSAAAVRAAVAGELRDWADLGGRPGPVVVMVAVGDQDSLPRALAIPRLGDAVQLLSRAALVEAVRATPGALAIVPVGWLEPGLLPLVVDGWDPLRDPAAGSPFQGSRWIQAETPGARQELARRLGWQEPADADPLGFVATGDFIPVRCVGSALRTAASGDFAEMLALVGAHLRAADVAVVSMEVAATALRPPTPCVDRPTQFVLHADPAVLDALAGAGIDVVTTAGNHAGDCYTWCSWHAALLDTLRELELRGLASTGTGATNAEARTPVILERAGVRIAILSYDAIAPWYWAEGARPGTAQAAIGAVAEDVAAARALADHVVVALSWGAEYVQTTTPAQEALVEAALEAGASLVVGNHPHTVQPLVERDGALVAYALGNFVFDQSWSTQTTQSVLLEVGFTRERLIGYRVRPVVIRQDFQPELVPPWGAEGQQVLDRLWGATDAWWAQHGSAN